MLYMVSSSMTVNGKEETYGVCYDKDSDMYYNSSDARGSYFSAYWVKFAVDWLLDEHSQYPEIIQKISIIPVL